MEPNIPTKPNNSGVGHYDLLLTNIEDRLQFKGKTMNEWAKELALPAVSDTIDEHTLAGLNRRAVELIETVYRNVASAKGLYVASKASYTKKTNDSKEAIVKEIEDFNLSPGVVKKKLPSNDALETQAFNRCATEFQAYTISEVFYDFWNYQVQKIQLFNARLTSLNIGKHTENKYANHGF